MEITVPGAVPALILTWKVRVAEAPAAQFAAVHTTEFWAALKVPAKGAVVVIVPVTKLVPGGIASRMLTAVSAAPLLTRLRV